MMEVGLGSVCFRSSVHSISRFIPAAAAIMHLSRLSPVLFNTFTKKPTGIIAPTFKGLLWMDPPGPYLNHLNFYQNHVREALSPPFHTREN